MGIVGNLGYKLNHGIIDGKKLVEELERAYDTFNETKDRTKTSFSPSQIGYGYGKCPRYWFIAFSGAEFVQDADAKSIANMQVGTAAHDRLGELFKRSNFDIIDIEQEVTNEYPPIRGFIDIILNRAGEPVIGEIKTTRYEAFLHRQAKMEAPIYHLIQILIYMRIKNIKNGFFLYENKNTQELLAIPVVYEDYEELIDTVWQWMEEVYDNFKAETLPKRPWRKNKKECQECPVRSVCWDELEEGTSELRTLPV